MNALTSSGLSRRQFLGKASLALAAPYLITSSLKGVNGPNNRIHLGAIGVGSRSRLVNEQNFAAFGDVRIVACADPDGRARERFTATINESYGGQVCQAYEDYRELLDLRDIDAVVVCTPDHWHVSLAAAAIRAGKDIYLEKPLSLSLSWTAALRKVMQGSETSSRSAMSIPDTPIAPRTTNRLEKGKPTPTVTG